MIGQTVSVTARLAEALRRRDAVFIRSAHPEGGIDPRNSRTPLPLAEIRGE
jgi:hypothetical protein